MKPSYLSLESLLDLCREFGLANGHPRPSGRLQSEVSQHCNDKRPRPNRAIASVASSDRIPSLASNVGVRRKPRQDHMQSFAEFCDVCVVSSIITARVYDPVHMHNDRLLSKYLEQAVMGWATKGNHARHQQISLVAMMSS